MIPGANEQNQQGEQQPGAGAGATREKKESHEDRESRFKF